MTQVPDKVLEWLAYVLQKCYKEVCEDRSERMSLHCIVGSGLEVETL